MIERSRVRLPAAALSGNDLGQAVHTNVPLLISWYLARAFTSTRLYLAANGMGPMNKGSVIVAVQQRSGRLELQYKLTTLLLLYLLT